MRQRALLLFTVALLLFGAVAISSAQNITIGLSVPSLPEEGFFNTLVTEAQTAAETAGVDLIVLSADDDPAVEAANITDLINQGVSALLVYPLDTEATLTSLLAANEADIPVFLLGDDVEKVESGLETAGLIAADPTAVGERAAEFFCEEVANGKSVLALSGISGVAEDTELADDDYRVVALQAELDAFSAAMAERCAGVNVVMEESPSYINADSITFLEGSLTADVGGVFAPNAELTLDSIRSARRLRLLSGLKIISTEVTAETLGALESARIAGIISAAPASLGQLGVEIAVTTLNEGDLEALAPVELALVDTESVTSFRGNCNNPNGCSNNNGDN